MAKGCRERDDIFEKREPMQQVQSQVELKKIREFATGATRDTDQGKFDFEGFLSPVVIRRFGEYMQKHRLQPDGSLRASDNWQKGIPKEEYMKSMWRHFEDLWLLHRGYLGVGTQDIEEALCGIFFNTQGYLHEHLKSKNAP